MCGTVVVAVAVMALVVVGAVAIVVLVAVGSTVSSPLRNLFASFIEEDDIDGIFDCLVCSSCCCGCCCCGCCFSLQEIHVRLLL